MNSLIILGIMAIAYIIFVITCNREFNKHMNRIKKANDDYRKTMNSMWERWYKDKESIEQSRKDK